MTQYPESPLVVPTPPPIDTCKTCRFWESADLDGDDGRCHYNAPPLRSVFGAPTMWPKTGSRDWCGQYVERPVMLTPVQSA